MSSFPQHLGVASALNRPQVSTGKQEPKPQFAAQLPEVPAAASQEPVAKVSAQVLKAQSGIKFGSSDAMPEALREQLTQQLIQTIEQKNTKLYTLLDAASSVARDSGEREITTGHLVLGMLKLAEQGLTRSPNVLGKATNRLSVGEKELLELVYGLMPAAKTSNLDSRVVLDQLKTSIQKVQQQVSANPNPSQQPGILFDQDLILLLKALERKGDLSTHGMPKLINFLSGEAAGLNLSAPSKATLKSLDDLKVSVKEFDPFGDIGGYNDVKKEIKLWLHLLQHPEDAADFGIKLEKGALLEGPPGTGKTLFARCIAKSVNGGFHAVTGSDFATKYLGDTSKNIRTLFDKARKEAEKTGRPVVVFIDEIDTIGRRRGTGGSDGASAEMENALNTLLSEIDGFEQNKDLIVIGATNRPEILDPALTRSGRLGGKFNIGLPDEEARKAIFAVHSKNKPLEGELNMDRWAELTKDLSGSDIEALMSAAAKVAFEDYVGGGRETKTITENDLLEAYKTSLVGRKNHSNTDPRDLELVVHHETFGHNAVAYALGYDIKIVTSVGRGAAGGYVLPTPGTKSRYDAGQMKSMLAELVYGLAGQAAEEELRGPAGVTYGASSDYQSARQKIAQMISTGMIPGHGTEDYSRGYAGANTQLSKQDQELAAYLLKASRETALKMIQAIPADVKQGMIDEAMGGIDYSFDDAMDFNRRHLGELDGPVIQSLREIFDEHVNEVVSAVQRRAEEGAEKYAKAKKVPPVSFAGSTDNVVTLHPQGNKRLNVFS